MAARPWPEPLEEEAFHGLAGEIVREIDPHTEADPVAVLADTLCMFGSMVGRGPFYCVESTRHRANLFVNLVGRTSRSRKGTAYDRAFGIAASADRRWSETRVLTGLASGEGIIHAVRDPREPAHEKDPGDAGISDKRLLAHESEFSSVIQKGKREGNVLIAVLRDAWDGRILANMTKNDSERATGAHVAMIGEITEEELVRTFDRVNIANGFGNRCLWISVRRSKQLPDGGSLDHAILEGLSRRLAEAADTAKNIAQVGFDDQARAVWREVYPDLTREVPGILGALTDRGEAQVVRLALIYALLDCSMSIREEHLRAALAFWTYCEQSVAHIFGDAIGDPTADAILAALRKRSPEGMPRTEISDLFSRNVSAREIDRALGLLQELRRTRSESRKAQGAGRPAEWWFSC